MKSSFNYKILCHNIYAMIQEIHELGIGSELYSQFILDSGLITEAKESICIKNNFHQSVTGGPQTEN